MYIYTTLRLKRVHAIMNASEPAKVPIPSLPKSSKYFDGGLP